MEELLKSSEMAARIGVDHTLLLTCLLGNFPPAGITRFPTGGFCPVWKASQIPEIKQHIKNFLNEK